MPSPLLLLRPRGPVRLLPALFALLVLSACPRRAPLKFGPEGEIEDPAILIEALNHRSASINGIKAEAKVRVVTPEQSGSVSEFIAAMRPAAIHLETLNFFGKPVAVLVSDGETFALFHEEEATWYTGPATAQNVSQLLPVVLSPQELTMLLLGDIPRIVATERSLEVDAERGAYLLTLRDGHIVQRLWVDTETLVPLRSEVVGTAAYFLALERYQTVEGLRFPSEIMLTTVGPDGKPTGVEMKLSYRDIELNPPADLTLFSLPQPPNTRRVEVDGYGQRLPEPRQELAPVVP